MGRFYFNFRQGESYSADEEGCKFGTVEEAYLGAVAAAQDIWRELLVQREDPLACAFEVTDDQGNDLFTLPFSEVLDACGSRTADTLPPKHSQIVTALETGRRSRKSMSDVSTAANEARATLRETLRLLAEIGSAAGK